MVSNSHQRRLTRNILIKLQKKNSCNKLIWQTLILEFESLQKSLSVTLHVIYPENCTMTFYACYKYQESAFNVVHHCGFNKAFIRKKVTKIHQERTLSGNTTRHDYNTDALLNTNVYKYKLKTCSYKHKINFNGVTSGCAIAYTEFYFIFIILILMLMLSHKK